MKSLLNELVRFFQTNQFIERVNNVLRNIFIVMLRLLNGALKFNNILSEELREARQIILNNNETSKKLDDLIKHLTAGRQHSTFSIQHS
ncbi:MAG: hypothetical protein ACYC49_17660 [Ignavibacteriaceae bacterium]